uniref:Pyruvate dehydrogenase complex component X n=1 Tax=Oncorhynchus tshawytscha TaxID=74940 RepID=A0A8C8JCQ5_ONCTS
MSHTLSPIKTHKAVVTLESNNDGILAKILMEEGSRAVHLGTLITVEIPPPGAAVPTQAPPPAAVATPPQMAPSAPPPPTPEYTCPTPPDSRPMYPPQSLPGRPGGTYTEITASNVWCVIAQRLTQSKTTIPHAYATVDCDLGAILQLRKEMAKGEIKVSVNDFIIKAEAALPEVNVTWSGEAPQALDSISISIAVEISANAKVGWNSTDTWVVWSSYISNLGMFGISGFSAVINPPQVCILSLGTSKAVHRLTEETLSTVTLSSDGCLVDDKLASRFLDKFCVNLDRPQCMSLA